MFLFLNLQFSNKTNLKKNFKFKTKMNKNAKREKDY